MNCALPTGGNFYMDKAIGPVKKNIIIFMTTLMALVGFVYIFNIYRENKLNDVITIEAGSDMPDLSLFLKDNKYQGTYITDIEGINLDAPHTHEIEIEIKKRIYTSNLDIIDTRPPKAKIVNHETWPEDKKQAKDFVRDIVDITDVKVYFKDEPDYEKIGEQEIGIILEDTSGNKTELLASLIIKADTEAPKIFGVKDQEVFVGDSILYRKGVFVTDNRDENPLLTIDSSQVNLRSEGTYTVTYNAIDSSGNRSQETSNIRVVKKAKDYVSEEELNILADEVLAKITNDDMTDIERTWAIYKWTRKHIYYNPKSDKTDWIKEAARGIQKGVGDCFTYYATSKILLTRAGYENILVNRDSDTSYHSWNLVKIQGNWYHFDTTVSRIGYKYIGFLRTDEEVQEYSEWYTDYYKFDKSKYPPTPIEKIQHERNL